MGDVYVSKIALPKNAANQYPMYINVTVEPVGGR